MLTTILDGWVALEEWKLRLTSAKVEVEAELGKKYLKYHGDVIVSRLRDTLKMLGENFF